MYPLPQDALVPSVITHIPLSKTILLLTFKSDLVIDGQVNAKTLASLTTSPLTNFTPPLTLIRYFQL